MNYQTSMSDETLIQYYLNGDANAMATLVELYKDRVYRSIYNMVQDKNAAEEIFGKVFTRIINNIMSGKNAEEGNFLQWAIRIAQSLCIEYTRKNQLSIIMKTTEPKESGAFTVTQYLPHTNYYESHNKIKSLIDMLPNDQREVLALNHYGDLSFKEIAEMMKCSLTMALDTMKVGLKNLQKLMVEREIMLQ
jgi:RNA polymerase sigma-70 factor (ECF subfamily)